MAGTRFATADNMKTLFAGLKVKYDVSMVAGASGGTADSVTSSGDTYLNIVEGGQNKGGIRLIPYGNMSIVSDDNGNVTFDSDPVTGMTNAEIDAICI